MNIILIYIYICIYNSAFKTSTRFVKKCTSSLYCSSRSYQQRKSLSKAMVIPAVKYIKIKVSTCNQYSIYDKHLPFKKRNDPSFEQTLNLKGALCQVLLELSLQRRLPLIHFFHYFTICYDTCILSFNDLHKFPITKNTVNNSPNLISSSEDDF